MLRPRTTSWAAALFIVYFATQGVSSASIGSFTRNEDVEYQVERSVSALEDISRAINLGPATNLLTCLRHYFDDIKQLSFEGSQLVANMSKIISESVAEAQKCGQDFNCNIGVLVTAFSMVVKQCPPVLAFAKDFKITAGKLLTCARYGVPAPAPTTTAAPTTPEPTTLKPTAPAPTTPKPTSPELTTPKPTTPELTTPKPTTPEPTTPAPIPPKPTTPAPTTPPESTSPVPLIADEDLQRPQQSEQFPDAIPVLHIPATDLQKPELSEPHPALPAPIVYTDKQQPEEELHKEELDKSQDDHSHESDINGSDIIMPVSNKPKTPEPAPKSDITEPPKPAPNTNIDQYQPEVALPEEELEKSPDDHSHEGDITGSDIITPAPNTPKPKTPEPAPKPETPEPATPALNTDIDEHRPEFELPEEEQEKSPGDYFHEGDITGSDIIMPVSNKPKTPEPAPKPDITEPPKPAPNTNIDQYQPEVALPEEELEKSPDDHSHEGDITGSDIITPAPNTPKPKTPEPAPKPETPEPATPALNTDIDEHQPEFELPEEEQEKSPGDYFHEGYINGYFSNVLQKAKESVSKVTEKAKESVSKVKKWGSDYFSKWRN